MNKNNGPIKSYILLMQAAGVTLYVFVQAHQAGLLN